MLNRPFLRPAAGLICALLCIASAHAAWKWRAADGSIQYSDQPPPASVAPRDVLSRPAAAPAAAAASRPASAPAAAAAAAADELQRRLAQEKKARDDAAALQRRLALQPSPAQQQNCLQARQNMQTLDSGRRVRVPDGHGGMVYLDDAGIQARRQQALAAITAYCR